MTTVAEKKHHYRKVFKSDHLGSADLEDFIEEKKTLIFTIEKVTQEMGVAVAGKKGNFNIAYFKEGIKPLVLNATNSKAVKTLAGGSPFVEDWKNVTVELYIDHSVKMKGEVVGGVRVKGALAPSLPFLTKDQTNAWTKAISHIAKGGEWTDIETRFLVSDETKKEIETLAKSSVA